MAADIEKIRDAAIALVTSTIYASTLEDPEEWSQALRSDFKHLSEAFDLSDEEFTGLPSILCQFVALTMGLLSREVDIPATVLWQQMSQKIISLGIPHELNDTEDNG